MTRHVRVAELLLGTLGLSLRRRTFTGTDDQVRHTIELIRRTINELDKEPYTWGFEIEGADALQGYELTAAQYDTTGGPDIEAEQPLMWELLERHTPGNAVDVACGTGRHLHRLLDLGHTAIGIDQSPAMLNQARQHAPTAELRVGAMTDIPIDSNWSDLTVCSLALEHEPEPAPAIQDLTRITRPGGTILISDVHPMCILLDHHAQFERAPNQRILIRAYAHLPSTLIGIFKDQELDIEECHEPTIGSGPGLSGSAALRLAGQDTVDAAWRGLPIAIIWQLRRRA